jgi:hypothetical protein
VEVAERFADGLADEAEQNAAVQEALFLAEYSSHGGGAWGAAPQAAYDASVGDAPGAAEEAAAAACCDAEEDDAVLQAERAAQGALVRDMLGNPCRPVAVDSDWLTPQVVALAQAAYEVRELPAGHLDPARLAVLADD